MSPAEPGVLVAARIGNAGGIVIGYGTGEMVLASDLAAVLPYTQKVAFLADGQLARIDASGADFMGRDGHPIDVPSRRVSIDPMSALKGDFGTFMLKEIMEQPEALSDTIHSLVTLDPVEVHLDDIGAAATRLATVRPRGPPRHGHQPARRHARSTLLRGTRTDSSGDRQRERVPLSKSGARQLPRSSSP